MMSMQSANIIVREPAKAASTLVVKNSNDTTMTIFWIIFLEGEVLLKPEEEDKAGEVTM